MTAPTPSEYARSLIGQEVHYSSNRPHREGKGTILDVEFAGCTIRRAGGDEWPGIRFRIRPLPGERPTRPFWTCAMPDMPPVAEEAS